MVCPSSEGVIMKVSDIKVNHVYRTCFHRKFEVEDVGTKYFSLFRLSWGLGYRRCWRNKTLFAHLAVEDLGEVEQ